ncbi:MAG: glycosyltransferase family 2 protein [Anaerolineae bacterium]
MSRTAVAVFAHRRPDHLARVLRALEVQLQKTPLPVHLFLDGPRQEQDAAAVRACGRVAEEVAASLDIQVHASAANRGLYRSLTEGVGEMLGLYPQLIVLEDDILTSPHFLRYMLDGLHCYADDARVGSIHGYTPPLPCDLPETFFLRGADCWGWATWRDRWKVFRSDATAMAAEIRDRGLAKDFDLGGRVPNLRLLDDRAAGRSKSWAICWHASCFLADRYALHPGRSLVRNIGLDHSGEHCGPAHHMETRLSERPVLVRRQPVEEQPEIVRAYANQIGRRPLPQRLITRLRSLAHRVSPAWMDPDRGRA